jgi:actin-related protein
MLPELSARLTKIAEQKRLKKKLEQDLGAVKIELHEATARFAALEARLEKEKVDVDKLERTSLTALFHAVLGSREQQLDKERQELLSAQLKVQQPQKQVDFLEQDRKTLVRQLAELAEVEAEYEVLLAEKDDLLRRSGQPVAAQLMALSGQVAECNSDLKEIREAITAGRSVIAGLDEVIAALDSAEGWGVWDLLGGGLLTTAVKHSRIDEARNGVSAVQAKLSRFKRELADVQSNLDLQVDIGGFDTFADFFFDGLIIDWIVQSKIENSLTTSKNAKAKMVQAVKKLEDLARKTRRELIDLHEKRALLIENT